MLPVLPVEKKLSLLAGLRPMSPVQEEVDEPAPHLEDPTLVHEVTPHRGSYYFSGHAGVKVKIETKLGEHAVERRRAAFVFMFDTLSEFLTRKGGRLGVDQAFKSKVLQQSLDVVTAVVQNQVPWGEPSEKRRLETKYVFVATVYLEMTDLLSSQQGECQIALGITDLIKCYSHLRISLGTLTKYLALVRQVLGKNDSQTEKHMCRQSSSAHNPRLDLIRQLFGKMLSTLVEDQECIGREHKPKLIITFSVPLNKLSGKASKLLSRLLELHEHALDQILVHRSPIQHAFALVYLIIVQLLSPSAEVPSLTSLLGYFQGLLPHLSTLNYYSVSSCIRMWKTKSLQLFRLWVKSGNYRHEKFLYLWVKQFPQEYLSALQEKCDSSDQSFLGETTAMATREPDEDLSVADSKICSPAEKAHFVQILRLLLKSESQTHLRTLGLLT